jgi:hypothetical protein
LQNDDGDVERNDYDDNSDEQGNDKVTVAPDLYEQIMGASFGDDTEGKAINDFVRESIVSPNCPINNNREETESDSHNKSDRDDNEDNEDSEVTFAVTGITSTTALLSTTQLESIEGTVKDSESRLGSSDVAASLNRAGRPRGRRDERPRGRGRGRKGKRSYGDAFASEGSSGTRRNCKRNAINPGSGRRPLRPVAL